MFSSPKSEPGGGVGSHRRGDGCRLRDVQQVQDQELSRPGWWEPQSFSLLSLYSDLNIRRIFENAFMLIIQFCPFRTDMRLSNSVPLECVQSERGFGVLHSDGLRTQSAF